MSKQEAKIAAANSIEIYGNVMLSKGLKARAQWAYEEARKLRLGMLVEKIDAIDHAMAAAA